MDSKRRKHTVGVTCYVHLQRKALIKKRIHADTSFKTKTKDSTCIRIDIL